MNFSPIETLEYIHDGLHEIRPDVEFVIWLRGAAVAADADVISSDDWEMEIGAVGCQDAPTWRRVTCENRKRVILQHSTNWRKKGVCLDG